jgi:hypothetical protein
MKKHINKIMTELRDENFRQTSLVTDIDDPYDPEVKNIEE